MSDADSDELDVQEEELLREALSSLEHLDDDVAGNVVELSDDGFSSMLEKAADTLSNTFLRSESNHSLIYDNQTAKQDHIEPVNIESTANESEVKDVEPSLVQVKHSEADVEVISVEGQVNANQDVNRDFFDALDKVNKDAVLERQNHIEIAFRLDLLRSSQNATTRIAREQQMAQHDAANKLKSTKGQFETALRIRFEKEKDHAMGGLERYQSLMEALHQLKINLHARTINVNERTETMQSEICQLVEGKDNLSTQLKTMEDLVKLLETRFQEESERNQMLKIRRTEQLDLREQEKQAELNAAFEAMRMEKKKEEAHTALLASIIWHLHANNARLGSDIIATIKKPGEYPVIDTKTAFDISSFKNLHILGASDASINLLLGCSRNAHLHAIDLSNNSLFITDFLLDTNELVVLLLRNTQLRTLQYAGQIKTLLWVDASANDEYVFSLDSIENSTLIQHVNISENDLPALPEINTLLLRQLHAQCNILKELTLPNYLPILQVLQLDNNLIETITPLQCCPMLTELYLRNNNIKDLCYIGAIAPCRYLEVLALTNNPVSLKPGFLQLIRQIFPYIQCVCDMPVDEAVQKPDAVLLSIPQLVAIYRRLLSMLPLAQLERNETGDRLYTALYPISTVSRNRAGALEEYIMPIVQYLRTVYVEMSNEETHRFERIEEDLASLRQILLQTYEQIKALCPSGERITSIGQESCRLAILHMQTHWHTGAAIILQTHWRSFQARRTFHAFRAATYVIAWFWRKYKDVIRKNKLAALTKNAAAKIQAAWKGYRVRQIVRNIRNRQKGVRNDNMPDDFDLDLDTLDDVLHHKETDFDFDKYIALLEKDPHAATVMHLGDSVIQSIKIESTLSSTVPPKHIPSITKKNTEDNFNQVQHGVDQEPRSSVKEGISHKTMLKVVPHVIESHEHIKYTGTKHSKGPKSQHFASIVPDLNNYAAEGSQRPTINQNMRERRHVSNPSEVHGMHTQISQSYSKLSTSVTKRAVTLPKNSTDRKLPRIVYQWDLHDEPAPIGSISSVDNSTIFPPIVCNQQKQNRTLSACNDLLISHIVQHGVPSLLPNVQENIVQQQEGKFTRSTTFPSLQQS